MRTKSLIDWEMEQTGEALTSPSYRARQANLAATQSRMRNPATGQYWFEAPSAEYQAWEKRGLDDALTARKTQGDQDIAFTDTIISRLRPKANDEANRALSNELKTRFPYAKYEAETSAARESMSDTLRTMPAFLNRNTAVRPQQYVSF